MAAISVKLQNAVSDSENGNSISTINQGAVAFQISGSFNGTVYFEATVDGINWVPLLASSIDGLSSAGTSAVAPGIWVASCTGLAQARARVAWGGGAFVTVIATTSAEASGLDSSTNRSIGLTTDTVSGFGSSGSAVAQLRAIAGYEFSFNDLLLSRLDGIYYRLGRLTGEEI